MAWGGFWLKNKIARLGERMRRLWIGLGVVLVVAAAAYASGFATAFTRSFAESRKAVLEHHPGIPSCDTETGLANAKAAMDNSPALKSSGISVLAIRSAKTSSSSESRVECEGEVILSSSQKGPISYSFTKDSSVNVPFLVWAKIDADSLQPVTP
jgi:hypothetical protein